ncbi:MAG: hypothetical protein ABGZ35_02335 [Planctomycetaceae bacterium]
MDAWKQTLRFIKFIQPAMATALAVLLLMTLLLGWISICGTSSLAGGAWCATIAGGVAVASLLERLIAHRTMLTLAASVLAVLSAVTGPVAYETCLRLGVGSGLPQIAIWLTAAIPAFVGSVAAGLLVSSAAPSGAARRLIGMVAGALLFGSHAWMSHSFGFTTAILASFVSWIAIHETATTADRRETRSAAWQRIWILQSLLSVAAGMGLVAGGMILHRVFAVSLITISASTVLAGITLLLAMLPILQLRKRPWMVWLCCMGLLAISPWCFTLLIGWNLHLRATTSTGIGMVFYHGLQLALWSVLTLMATNAGSQVVGGSERSASQARLALMCVGAAIACGLTEFAVGPNTIALAAISIIAGIPVGLLLQVPANSRSFHLLRLTGSVLAVAAIGAMVASPPDLSGPSRLLFTMRPLAAVHRGIDQEMIPETDAARMIASQESAEGTVTKWKTQADVVEIRVNGQQVSAVSTNTSTTPQPAAEILTCVLPLIVHPHPGTVMLLDDYSGVAVATCEEFPLHRIVVVKPGAISGTDSTTAKSVDERIHSLSSPPEMVIRNGSIAPVDVVISMVTDPVRGASLARLSQSWFQAASERLAPDGVYCQRIRLQHIGQGSLLRLLGRASAVFDKVAVVQLLPGEIALLASNSEVPLLDEGVLARMERQHVRRQLGRCGWDWCQLAALAIVDSADPIGLWTHNDLPAVADATTGLVGLRLGWETVRPSNHGVSIHQLLGPHQVRIAEAVPTGPAHDEFRRRISAYAQQVEIFTAFPDEPWIYRKSLKIEMQRNQRPPEEEIRDGQIHRHIHPLDEYRKSYFTTLGKLLQQVRSGTLSVSDMRKLSDYSVDYEPLISDFAHHELVQIHELAGHPSPTEEFKHRLHTVNYTQPGDYSIRTVVAALKQLTDQPELMANDADRFDQLNSLVQELILRWESRTSFESRSAVRMQRDVELSITTVQSALNQLEQLAGSAGKTRAAFLTRRHFVSAALIGPLRQYRDQVLAHRAKHGPLVSSIADIDVEPPGSKELPMLLDQPNTN